MSSLHKEGVVWRRGEVGENWEDGREVRVYFMRKESVSNGKKQFRNNCWSWGKYFRSIKRYRKDELCKLGIRVRKVVSLIK